MKPWITACCSANASGHSPSMLRWNPIAVPEEKTDFIDGLVTMAANGSANAQTGIGIHVYVANGSMEGRYFYNAKR